MIRKEVVSSKREIREFLKNKYQRGCIFGIDRLTQFGEYWENGIAWNYRPYLKEFLFKQHGIWTKWFAPNKTALRNAVYGKIDAIIEISK